MQDRLQHLFHACGGVEFSCESGQNRFLQLPAFELRGERPGFRFCPTAFVNFILQFILCGFLPP
jgi:hypothetical protein